MGLMSRITTKALRIDMISTKFGWTFTLLALLFIQGCRQETTPVPQELEIYCIHVQNPKTLPPLDAIKLPENPLFTMEDIRRVDWDTLEIDLTEKAWNRIDSEVTRKAVEVKGLPFVVLVNSERIYVGYFWTRKSSFKPLGPVVLLENIKKRRFLIQGYGESIKTMRDPRIHQALIAAKKIPSSE